MSGFELWAAVSEQVPSGACDVVAPPMAEHSLISVPVLVEYLPQPANARSGERERPPAFSERRRLVH